MKPFTLVGGSYLYLGPTMAQAREYLVDLRSITVGFRTSLTVRAPLPEGPRA